MAQAARLIALGLALAACSPATGGKDGGADLGGDGGGAVACGPEAAAGHQVVTCAGVRFDVEASAACASGGCGLVVDVHGYSMTADEEDRHTRMRALAPPRGYVVVQPTAPGSPPTWGAGENDHVSDGAVWAFVEATIARFRVDPKRVHMMGFSQGAMLTFRMLCAHADRLASVAPAAGVSCYVTETSALQPPAAPSGRAPSEPVPILYTHGTADRVVTFASAQPALAGELERRHGLDAGTAIRSDAKARAVRRSGGGRAVVELWEHDYESSAADRTFIGGHCLPGPIAPGDGQLSGATRFRCLEPDQYDFGLEALRFFAEHPRP